MSASAGRRRPPAGERGSDQAATAGKNMLREMYGGEIVSDRSSLPVTTRATAMQRDDQTLTRPAPREKHQRKQHSRQQVEGAFGERRADASVQCSEDKGNAQQAAREHRELEPSDGRRLPTSHDTGCGHDARSYRRIPASPIP